MYINEGCRSSVNVEVDSKLEYAAWVPKEIDNKSK